MLFCGISILDENFNLAHDLYVGVQGDRITYIGTEEPEQDFGRCYSGKGRFMMPGLYNSHAHSPMTLLRGYAENLSLQDWLHKKVFPFEARMLGEDIFKGSKLAIAEMLRFGTCSFSDMYYMGEDVFEAVAQTGIKCNFSRGVTVFDGGRYESQPAFEEAEKLLKNHHGGADGRFKLDLSIHAEYTSNPSVVASLARHASDRGLNIHIHLSETKDEHEGCKERHGKTPAKYFYDLGIFNSPTTAAHCVWLEDEDFDILLENNITVAACPASNLKLASGFARVEKMFDLGLKVAIGSDGAASNNNLDLFTDAYLFAILYKGVSGNPSAITPKEVLKAATRTGALAQGRDDSGIIKVGAKADLIVLDIKGPHMQPVHNMLNNIVYCARGNDVCLNMIDGRVLYEDGDFKSLDIEKVSYEAAKSTEAILARL